VLLDQYLASARSAQALTEETRDDVEGDVVAARIVMIVAALVVALGQIVPFWYGTELVSSAERGVSATGS
jgi:hypothetical protein